MGTVKLSRGNLHALVLSFGQVDTFSFVTLDAFFDLFSSNRDLSMILDALLKTKSRTVLVDIINKNGK